MRLILSQLILPIALLLAACVQANAQTDPPFILPKPSDLNKLHTAILYTDKGDIRFELYPEDAPWHVANFKYLADKGFYHNLTFHILIPGYIIQGGAPSPKDPNSGPGYDLPSEFSERRHEEGVLGMARLPDAFNRERRSHGSQFHILLASDRRMNGAYTIFGKVVDGLDVLHKLEKGDRIRDLRVFVRPD